ncbi:hypothetical protein Vretimale_2881 [Volvox reticuliferus]|uniref:Uncharacterized protein n=1 Tax=Volvox reticuliferus TaxID=1737510 RepID=A0A8J4FZP0_9CHLO|nr:hypothetical protein Vretifemale_1848 [Volvox reticuliferus]GIL97147.1 hypothetical protein Vretimale_2881 [Volvox reticuliferus]
MTWPVHLARLLPSLPKLDTLLADMYVYAYDEDEDDDGNSGTASRVRCNSHRRRGSRTTREERGNGGGEVGCAAAGGSGAERLYEEMLEVASGLRGVHHVEFQLSVMREERWEWPRLVRVLARVRNLRGLTLRLPRRGSGPQLRAQHLTSLCRSLTGLRRLTLLVAHPTCVKLNAKALQALQELPFIQLVQLHLGGMWEGRRVAPNVRGRDAVNVARGRFSGSGGGGGDGDGDGDGSSRLRQTSSNAAANRPAGDALHSSRRTGRSGKQGKYGKGEGSASPGMAAPAWHRSNLETTATAVGPVRAARGGDGGTGVSTVMCVPPMLPGSEAARAVLAAARGLGCFYGNSKGQRQPRRGGDRHSGGGSGADHTDTDDSSADTDRDTDSVASSGGSDTGAASHQNNDAPSENDIGGSSSGGQGCSMSGSSGNDGSSVRTQGQVELQVDFLTAREAAQVNSVLRWERRPARVRAGLWPRWVWADLVNCFN